ncbi:cysteine tRNA synthetase (Cysteine--tRNA ligase) [Bradyrhizobium sp. ORS 285]|uniref:cysteine--tRNA ligase n=1 Tax=Bradyrhizobium sp. ORS 285 TaxID=115808 RepID=UPI0002407DC2|nr:cysteine--tRNA ligase [Bradyrhizobium sp. ORS 285]CCD83820.1 cysteine tRNA synthetase (Cysteine--tRNA ligase) [Bradyrhizobium sp. ORS 285]SMX59363.1 cysteine tRNA synthetase (Cysteine--tRNA ligase) [Bradyrhizobium sp. ORS 285]
MDLRLYDTASREKRPFVPLDPNNVRMYVCGPTVYDFAHIGNARPVIVFDVLFRLLRHVYGPEHVTYVRNITDVDDKINARAARDFPGLPLNEAIRKVTEVTANQFHSDTAALGSLPPTFEPRATDFVLPRPDGKADMVTLIKQLIARGHAYETGGEVLFDTQSMPDYGALSGRRLDEQLAGARVAVDAHKKNPADFVLWKQSSDEEPGWDSPWGRGRPGWHIECSAMSAAYLGEVFDIHGGGLDLIFPHHENEIAQSRCAHGTSVMANYWLHNEFVQVEGAKMSKSLGNFVTIRDLLADWPGEVLRLNMLKMHYRSPADWTVKNLEESAKTLDDWYRVAADAPGEQPEPAIINALLDDINTPLMIAELHALRSRAASGGEAERAAFAGSLRYVGFLSETSAQWEARKQEAKGVDAAKVEGLIAERAAARARKDFKESDRLRDELVAMGVVLKDGKGADGKPVTTWEIAR